MFLLIISLIALTVLITVLVENELGTVLTIGLIGLFTLGYFVNVTNPYVVSTIQYVLDNPGTFFLGLTGYLVFGLLYSFLKWSYFVKRYKKSYSYSNTQTYPKAEDNITSIVRWISYWPFSLWWTLLDQPIKQLVFKLSYVYDSISKKIYEAA